MDLIGELTLSKKADGIRLGDARPPRPLKAMRGLPVAQVAKLLPRIFAICGHAHHNAFLRAASAAGAPVLVTAEAAREELLEQVIAHGWRFAVTWMVALGQRPDGASLRALKEAVACRDAVVRVSAMAELLGTEKGAIRNLRRDATDVLSLPLGHEGEGLAILGSPPAAWWAERLETGQVLSPQYAVLPYRAEGERLYRLGDLVDRLSTAALVAAEAVGTQEMLSADATNIRSDDGYGVGLADTARGPLVYRVAIDRGRVAEIDAITPTDWIAQPDGPLAQTLARLPISADALGRAMLVSALFDPCVPVREGIGHA